MDAKSLQLLQNLYADIETHDWDDSTIAHNYARLWWDEHEFTDHKTWVSNHSRNAGFVPLFDDGLSKNIALLNSEENLDMVCKRGLLISDICLFHDVRSSSAYCIDSRRDSPATGVNYTSIDYDVYLSIADSQKIGKFIRANKKLILSGSFAFIPNITVNIHEDNFWGAELSYVETPSEAIINSLQKQNTNASSTISRRVLEDKYIRFVAEVSIPYIDNVSSDMMLAIIEDNKSAFTNFRIYLKEKMLDLHNSNDSENFDTLIKRTGIDLEKGLICLSSDIKKLTRNTIIRAGSGIILGSMAATLVAISGAVLNQQLLTQFLAYLTSGGGIISAAKFAEDYFDKKQSIEETPFYFVWLFHKK